VPAYILSAPAGLRALILSLLCVASTATQAALQTAPAGQSVDDLAYIDTSIENASPVWYERAEDGAYLVHLLYDHERNAPNRAAGHIHVRLVGRPGARITLEFRNLDNVWNGRPGSVAAELKTVAISPDGQTWTTVPTDALPGNRVRVTLTMPGQVLYVARMQPYRLSDFDRLLALVRTSPHASVTTIGQTVQGRPIEIIRIGTEREPATGERQPGVGNRQPATGESGAGNRQPAVTTGTRDPGPGPRDPRPGVRRVFVRARAHPWEAGSSWVAQGLVERLMRDDAEARAWRGRYVLYVLPMANKDGVARGGTRFNANGKDLNRNWDRPADPALVPENAALERWLEDMIATGRAPDLAIELHNDGRGLLHISRPRVPQLPAHLERMSRLEAILRARTWFTEGHTDGEFRNSGTLGDGWLERYGIDALVHELNANWIEGLKSHTSAAHWQAYGASLAGVFDEYLRGR
jgi:hypothetical protein